jgi:hypothetical protein
MHHNPNKHQLTGTEQTNQLANRTPVREKISQSILIQLANTTFSQMEHYKPS